MTTILTVPASFIFRPFFEEGAHFSINDEAHFFNESANSIPFYDDLLNVIQIDKSEQAPWHEPKRAINQLVDRWNNQGKPYLARCYQQRNRLAARPVMIQYTAYFIQGMHWIDGQPVTSLRSIMTSLKDLPFSPMNVEDRLAFVLTTVDHHHAFITLTQLYDEARKKWALYQK
ncbi:hypothetical protein CR194_03175 [Salipaludibacillus keqinensis]|uniref:YpoC-like domain-containing protein n=1 Tax=Salipaludibacillus keqinensis TaxID=2045207 RepID=A0A323TID8_9BACI|nr:hypothetical protein [Salipaludibacillus keqinensis]PYZ94549.1 hypothetical protein CR194_03175 [Salipaludibacillus keqinensis]